jgi:AAA domain
VRALTQTSNTYLYFIESNAYRRKYKDLVNGASSGTGKFEALSMAQCRARKQDSSKVAEGAVIPAYCAACYQRFNGGAFVNHPCIVGCEFKDPHGVSVIVTCAEGSIARANSARFKSHLQSLEAQLNTNQAVIYEEIICNPGQNYYVGGDAGTGKSHVLRVLVRALDRLLLDTRKLMVVALTNISANNIGGRTVNSWLMLSPGCDDAAGQAYGGNPSGHSSRKFVEIASSIASNLTGRREEFRRLEVLIIDEVFLLTGHMFALIDAVLRELRSCQDIPFGGLQVIVFGDAQLQPLGKPWSWFFASDTFTNGNFKVCLLNEVVRQKDAKDVEQLRLLKIGGGENPQKFLDDVNSSWGSAVKESDLQLCQRARELYKSKIGVVLFTPFFELDLKRTSPNC